MQLRTIIALLCFSATSSASVLNVGAIDVYGTATYQYSLGVAQFSMNFSGTNGPDSIAVNAVIGCDPCQFSPIPAVFSYDARMTSAILGPGTFVTIDGISGGSQIGAGNLSSAMLGEPGRVSVYDRMGVLIATASVMGNANLSSSSVQRDVNGNITTANASYTIAPASSDVPEPRAGWPIMALAWMVIIGWRRTRSRKHGR